MKNAVLIVLPWPPELPGGVSVVVRNLARIWRGAGVCTTIAVSDWNSKNRRVDSGGTVTRRFAIIDKLSISSLVRSFFFAPVTLFRTFLFLRDRKIASVYFHYAGLDAIGIAFLKKCKLYRGRFILCFHGTDIRPARNFVELVLWRFVFSSADAITACSRSLSRDVEQNFSLAKGVVTTVYNGVDTSVFAPLGEKNVCIGNVPFGNCDDYIVSVGSYIERKGHIFLVDAFAAIADLFPTLGLLIIGMDGDQRIRLIEHIKSLGLDNRVKLLIDLRPEDVAPLVAGAKACVQPSLAEPFGMAVIEAGACGTCVAASNVGGHAELIEDGKTGYLFSPSDRQGIASALLGIMRNEKQRNDVAGKFREQVLTRYTWVACATAYGNAGSPGGSVDDGAPETRRLG